MSAVLAIGCWAGLLCWLAFGPNVLSAWDRWRERRARLRVLAAYLDDLERRRVR